MTTWITVCDTCKRDGDPLRPATQIPEGNTLAEMVETAARGHDRVRVRRHSCLMGCARACNVTIQGTGKIGYTLAEFSPTPDDAAAIVGYAVLHAQSATGQVPYKQWPEGVKGHFASRHMPVEPT